ncbi:hypothetical protein [Enterocloster lavalensis]|uniref:hypothetical protein n=1 Tax=Enterocloster lavalensis TaxID=460384 RepID=UPI0034A3442D
MVWKKARYPLSGDAALLAFYGGVELWGGERLADGIKKSNISWKMSKTGRAETMV